MNGAQETLSLLKQRAAKAFDIPEEALGLMRHGAELPAALDGMCVFAHVQLSWQVPAAEQWLRPFCAGHFWSWTFTPGSGSRLWTKGTCPTGPQCMRHQGA